MKKLAFFFLMIAVIVACKTKQEVTAPEPPPRPNWVISKPIETQSYAGIGMAYKNAGADYISIAKNNALNDLSSEISVNISSSSLFYQIEQDDHLREEFQANTRLKSKENLEGYELVGSYENNHEYWVYYRLNKAEYQALKAKRLESAIGLSKQFYTNAIQFKDENQLAESIKFNIKAIAALKDYLADPIQTEWNGKEVFFLPELYGTLQQTVSSIQLSPVKNNISIKRGQAATSQDLAFLAKSKSGKPLGGIPIYLYYSGDRIQNNQLYTNTSGLVSYQIDKVTSKNSKEYMQANINMVALVSEATEDPFIRKLVGKISGAEARIEITIARPSVFIESTESNLGKPMASQLLAAAFKQGFIDEGFSVSIKKTNADYYLTIEATTKESTPQQRLFTATLDATFLFYDEAGNLLYQKPIQGFLGVQISAERAGEDAYLKLATEIEKRYFREMRRKVFD